MASVTFEGTQYHLNESETVLECLLRQGVALPHGCRSGVCQSCMMQLISGQVPAVAQQGLKPALRQQKNFLPCVCRPEENIEMTCPSERVSPHIEVKVLSKERLNDNIVRLRMECPQPFDYRAGQFIHLQHADDRPLIRSYSLASVARLDSALEIHVRRVPDGRMSGWIHQECQPGQRLWLSTPQGECHYISGDEQQGLLLLATGAGLAPLWGILRDALEQGHSGPIRLFHGGRVVDDLYLVDELRALAAEHGQFAYFPCLAGDGVAAKDDAFFYGRVQEQALSHQPDLQGWRVYLCGNPAMVNDAKRKVFLAGAALTAIHADPFVMADSH